MSDLIINPLNPPAVDATAHNDEVARKLAAQDMAAPANLSKPADGASADTALDALAKQAEEAAKQKAAAAPAPDPVTPPAPDPAAEAAKKAAEEAQKKADEIFKDSPQLPPNASPKSSEAFASIKIKAAQDISALNEKLEAANKQLAEFQERAKNPSTKELELQKQVEDLSGRLAKLDVDIDPKFKNFDDKIKAGKDFIYDQLRQAGVVDEAVIKEIEKYGGPHKVKMEKVYEALAKDQVATDIVKSKIAELVTTQYEKDKAIQNTKANIATYQQERQKFFEDAAANHTKAATDRVNQIMGAFDWNKPVTVDAKMTAEQKAAAEATNKSLQEINSQVQEALRDDSPEMRAILIAGYAQLVNLQRVHEAAKTSLAAAEKARDEAVAKLDKIKNSSRSRLAEGAAPADGRLPQPKPADTFNTRPGDALDQLAKQVAEQRAAAAVK